MDSPSMSITTDEQLKTVRDTIISSLASIVSFYVAQYAGLPADQQLALNSAIFGICMYLLRFFRKK